MLSEKRMNRKADVTITTIILIILGLVVLVMVIIGFTKGTDFFFGIFNKGPSELQSVAKACEGYVQANLGIDFCKYRLISTGGSDDELVNCHDSRIEASLNTAGVNYQSIAASCGTSDSQNRQRACDGVASGKKASTRINGEGTCGGVSGIVVTKETLTFDEVVGNKFNPSNDKFGVKLSAEPSGSVTLTFRTTVRAEVSPISLTFTKDDWSNLKDVTVTPKDDTNAVEDRFSVDIVGFGGKSVGIILKELSP